MIHDEDELSDSQMSRRMEDTIQGQRLMVTPAPESVKKSLARSESSRMRVMESSSRAPAPVSLFARENRKSRKSQSQLERS